MVQEHYVRRPEFFPAGIFELYPVLEIVLLLLMPDGCQHKQFSACHLCTIVRIIMNRLSALSACGMFAGRHCSSSRHNILRGYPSPVKGAGFRVPSRRRSQVQLLPHANIQAENAVMVNEIHIAAPGFFL